jgi:beta-glucanase (GH16 family)
VIGGMGAAPTKDDLLLKLDTSHLQLTFDDEFDSLSLYNPATGQGTWDTIYSGGAPRDGQYSYWNRTLPGNKEEEIYVDPTLDGTARKALALNPFAINDGVLSITARRTPDDMKAALWGYNYISGLLTTQHSFAQTYGYFEMRAELPKDKGMFPAFWLVPQNGMWPPEIDVMEQIGGPNVYHTVITKQTGIPTHQQFEDPFPQNSTGFHTYGVLWTAQTLTWYVDGKAVAAATTPADMHGPMVIRVNLAVGGTWAGSPDISFVSDDLKIDYIRAYQLTDTPHR